jgi:photosystem II stability/assembly factor-like uncharacterized protein
MRSALLLTTLLLAAAASAQWQIQSAPTTADLRGIDNLGKGIAWASGSEGTVLRTTDDGDHWQRCATPPGAEALDFRGIQAFDASTAIVMSSGKGPLSRLYKTTDACQSWTLLFTNPDPEGFWDAVRFRSIAQSPNHQSSVDYAQGVLLGDPVNGEFTSFVTADGGGTWTRRLAQKHDRSHECSVEKFAALPGEAVFAASNEALANDDLGSFYFVTGGAKSRLAYVGHFRDFDGLLCSDVSKFIKLPLGGSPSAGAFASAAKTSKGQALRQMMVVGGDYRQREESAATAVFVSLPPTDTPFSPTMYMSVRRAKHPPHGFRSAVAYDEAAKSWITVGPNGTDISTDDGRNWRALKPTASDPPDADQHWNALSLPFVVGPHGRIGKSRMDTLKP